jgi:hypothetical protein
MLAGTGRGYGRVKKGDEKPDFFKKSGFPAEPEHRFKIDNATVHHFVNPSPLPGRIA